MTADAHRPPRVDVDLDDRSFLDDIELPHPRAECIEAIEAVLAILHETGRITRLELEVELDPYANFSIGLAGAQSRLVGAEDAYLNWWWEHVILPALRAHPVAVAHDDTELTWSLGPDTREPVDDRLVDAAIAMLARSLKRDARVRPESVDLDDVLLVLEHHPMPPAVHEDGITALERLRTSRDIDGRFVDPLVTLLERPAINRTTTILTILNEIAATDPPAVLAASEAVIDCVTAEPTNQSAAALSVCSTLIEHDSVSFVDLAPVAGIHLGGPDGPCRRHAAYIMQKLATHSPEAVAPHVDTIRATIEDASTNYQRNALIALGNCATVVDDPRDLVATARRLDGVPDDMVRANAVGVIADATSADPAAGADLIDDLVAHLNDIDEYVRINASLALSNIALEDPSACRDAIDPLLDALDDLHPAVRRNACRALGHVGSIKAYERLQARSISDVDPGVRRLASWAAMNTL